jgi:undecaprenyl diphosphate synthase
VDLLIRTGGEKRLSDFMLWESAYAELVFRDQMWPDFGPNNLREAVEEFHRRDRRYGALEITEAPSNEESPSAIVPLPTWEGVRG